MVKYPEVNKDVSFPSSTFCDVEIVVLNSVEFVVLKSVEFVALNFAEFVLLNSLEFVALNYVEFVVLNSMFTITRSKQGSYICRFFKKIPSSTFCDVIEAKKVI